MHHLIYAPEGSPDLSKLDFFEDLRMAITSKNRVWERITTTNSLNKEANDLPKGGFFVLYRFNEHPDKYGMTPIVINKDVFYVFIGDGPTIWNEPEHSNNMFNLNDNVWSAAKTKEDLFALVRYYSQYYPILIIDENTERHVFGKWRNVNGVLFSCDPNRFIKKKQQRQQEISSKPKKWEKEKEKERVARHSPTSFQRSGNSGSDTKINRYGFWFERANPLYSSFLLSYPESDAPVVVSSPIDLSWSNIKPGDLLLTINNKPIKYSDLRSYSGPLAKESSKPRAEIEVMRYDNSNLSSPFKKLTITKV